MHRPVPTYAVRSRRARAAIMHQMPHRTKAVVFDLDDTLAPSKSPLDPSMATALVSLLQRLPVCIISGGRFEQFQAQVLDRLTAPEQVLSRLHLMPTCGTRYYSRQHCAWSRVYSEDLSAKETARIMQVLEETSRTLGYWEEHPWGALIEDRGSQVTYSALGQAAPLDAKAAWDPDGTKKSMLVAHAAPLLPDFEVRGGGSTSIDVTRKGIDKAYGVRKLMVQLQVAPEELLFVGDRLDETGNDYPVLAVGVPCVPVTSWQDTHTVIAQFNDWWDGVTGSPQFRIISKYPNAARHGPAGA
jgi:phosphomannomutase